MPTPPVQFSIRQIMAATAVAAAWCDLWVAQPSWQVGLVELIVLFGSPLFWMRDRAVASPRARAFSLGTVLATAFSMLWFLQPSVNSYASGSDVTYAHASVFRLLHVAGDFRQILVLYALAPIVGLVFVGIQCAAGTNLVLLEPGVRAAFPTDAAVDEAIRSQMPKQPV